MIPYILQYKIPCQTSEHVIVANGCDSQFSINILDYTIASILQNFRLDVCRCIAVPEPLSNSMIVYDARFTGNHPFFDGIWNLLMYLSSSSVIENIWYMDRYIAKTPWIPDRFVTYTYEDIYHLINDIDQCCYICMSLDLKNKKTWIE